MALINKIFFCVLSNNKCIYHLHLVHSPLYCINNQHDVKLWGENQRIMFDLDPSVEKWFSSACLLLIFRGHPIPARLLVKRMK